MRTSRPMRERPINTCGLACADQGQPRAALDRRKIKPTLDVRVNQIIVRHCRKAKS